MTPREQQEKFLSDVREGPGFLAMRETTGVFEQHWFPDSETVLQLVDRVSDNHDLWISMATFPDERSGRQATNASELCSFWLDVDAHEGSAYQDPHQAYEAVTDFVKRTGLPSPNLIHHSGYGVHAIWTLTERLSRDEWQPIASKLQELCRRCALGADPITADAARILRMPGTLNFRNPSQPVQTRLELVSQDFISVEAFGFAVEKALQKFPPLSNAKPIKQVRTGFDCPPTPVNISVVREMLKAIDPDPQPLGGGNRSDWMRIVWATAATGWGQVAYDLARDWSQRGDLFDEDEFEKVWNSYDPERTTNGSQSGVSFGTLVHFARRAGYSGPLPAPATAALSTSAGSEKLSPSLLVTTRASDITPEPVEWLVDQSIPLGAMVVIGGQPGMGKSQIAISLAAAVTTGAGLPDGSTFDKRGSVIILANEDDAARTIRPRLDAAGADLSSVHIVQGIAREGQSVDLFQLGTDIQELRIKAHSLGDVRLIVIDPPSAYIGSKVDSYKDSDVRQVLMPLGSLAQETGALILLVVHLNKRNDGGAQQRFGGSTAWIAAPRAAFLVAEDPTTRQRFMLPVKNNLGDDRTGFEYQVHEKLLTYGVQIIKAPFVKWQGKSQRSAIELLDPPRKNKSSVVDEAKEFLECELGKGAVSVLRLKAAAEAAGFSWASVERAKKGLLIASKRVADGWEWELITGADYAGLE